MWTIRSKPRLTPWWILADTMPPTNMGAAMWLCNVTCQGGCRHVELAMSPTSMDNATSVCDENGPDDFHIERK